MRRSILFAGTALLVATSAAAIDPGEWTTTVDLIDIELPEGAPAQVEDLIRAQMTENAVTSSSCITQEEIDNAPEEMFQETDGQCEYTEFEMSGGTINGVAQCNTGQGTMNMVMSGTYTDQTYTMTMDMAMESPMGGMDMTTQVNGQRVGECN